MAVNEAPKTVPSAVARGIALTSRLLAVRDPWHRSPRVESLRRVVGRVAWEAALKRVPPGRVYRQRLASGAEAFLDVSDRIQGEAALLRGYEPTLVRALVDLLPPDGVLFDVGANVGLVAIDVLALHQSATVHAFEPHPANLAALRRNLAPHMGDRARVVSAAAGAERGELELVVGHEAGAHRLRGSGEALDGEARTLPVDVLTLDDYAASEGIERIDVMKLDVEGFELGVLQGASALLERGAIRAIVTEAQPDEQRSGGVAKLLADHGFTAQEIPSVSPAHLLSRTAHLAPRDFVYRQPVA
jgi:FkbM family methyltransferase